jgi:glycosyltransferase involved in cell wall biosynthesis
MRVTLIRREYITYLDGINKFIAWLGEGLAKLGHEVFLASWCYSGDVGESSLSAWFKRIHGLDVEIPVYTLERGPCRGTPWFRIMSKWWSRGKWLLERNSADIAVVNGVLPLRFKPKVAVAHGPILKWSLARRLVQRALYSTFDRVICVSEETRRQCSKAGILSCHEIIPLPVKLDLYKPVDLSARKNIVVHIGTRPTKNPHISVKVVEELRNRGINIELVVIGSRRRELEELVKGKSFVRVLSAIQEREKIDILCSAKAFILPSSAETFSYATVEAMACGTPVVVSEAVPSEVVINEYNGIRVNGLNYSDYVNALERILRDEHLWSDLSRNALNHVKQFDQLEIAKRYEKALRELV